MMLYRQKKQRLNEFLQLTHYKEYRDFSLILLELKQKYDQLQVAINDLELERKILKKFVITIDYRIDYELRREIRNIADKIIVLYHDKIDKINVIEYLLELSIEDIENKIVKIQKRPYNIKKMTLEKLTEKNKNGLFLLNNFTNKKLENNKESKVGQIPKYNTSIRFLSKTKNDKDIQDGTILNLYFIKKMNETFNNNI